MYLHIDMDCYFSACEEKRNPELKGKPVIIGYNAKRGVVSTANYEARKYGVKSAMPMVVAEQRCQDAIFIEPDYGYYVQESKNIMDELKEFDPCLVQVSIDEAYLDITSFSKNFSSYYETGKNIQEHIYGKTGLPCSIGIAKSKIVAKMATEERKPNGITVVEDIKEFSYRLSIEKIPGIGKKSLPYYNKNGVYRIKDLVDMDRFAVLERFGMHGVYLQQIFLGENAKLSQRPADKSLSREMTFEKDTSDFREISLHIDLLCERLCEDLEKNYYKTISVKIRFSDFRTITRSYSLGLSTKSLDVLKQYSKKLFFLAHKRKKIRLIGVKLSGLKNMEYVQKKLFEYI